MKKIILSLFFALSITNLNGITNKTASRISKAVTILISGIFILDEYNSKTYEENLYQSIIKFTLAASSTYMLSKIFYWLTPTARVKNAKSLKKQHAELLKLLDKEDFHRSNLVNNIKKIYIKSEFPLVQAFRDLVLLSDNINSTIQNLEQAKKDDSNEEFSEEIEGLLQEFTSIIERLNESLLIIKDDLDFSGQAKAKKLIEDLQKARTLQIIYTTHALNTINPHTF